MLCSPAPELQKTTSSTTTLTIGPCEQVLEILSHVNKRIKGHAAIQLPLQDLLQTALDPQAAPLVRNFGLVYAEMACERAPLPTCLEAVQCPAGHVEEHGRFCMWHCDPSASVILGTDQPALIAHDSMIRDNGSCPSVHFPGMKRGVAHAS